MNTYQDTQVFELNLFIAAFFLLIFANALFKIFFIYLKQFTSLENSNKFWYLYNSIFSLDSKTTIATNRQTNKVKM